MKTMHHTIVAVAIIGALLPAAARAGDPGSSGALFLRLGLGARASGMGEAFTAVAEDASAIYWNPGAMAPVLGTNLVLMHNEFIQSVRLEQVAVTHETTWGTLGLSFTGLYMDDMERREDFASAIPLGEFGAYDVSFAAAFARYIVPNVSLGVAVKSVFQRIDEVSAKGVAVDVGIYHISRIEGVKFAAVVGNLGPQMKFDTEEFPLPAYGKIGASFERPLPALNGGILATLDVMFPNDDGVRQHIGAEYNYQRMLFLRGGYKAGYTSQGATFGLGVNYRGVDVDYALMLVSNDLGDSHRIGLGFTP